MGKSSKKKPNMGAGMYNNVIGPNYELARAYVPIQVFNQQYRPEVALQKGTIFPELYRPYPPCYRRND